MMTRREFTMTRPLASCACADEATSYDAAVTRIWAPSAASTLQGTALQHELVRCATLAPSSHNTQCWKFSLASDAITIWPDLSRRCPVVDPDDHHLTVSLGCAAENLVQAALAHGLIAEPSWDAGRETLRIGLQPATASASPWFLAIPKRQSTRAPYDGQPLSSDDLRALERAAAGAGVQLLLLTDKAAMDKVLDFVVQGNTAQVTDPAFVKELKSWIRFGRGPTLPFSLRRPVPSVLV